MPTMYLRPLGGLANRLMPVLSAMRLSYIYGFDLAVSWDKDANLSAPPSDLFYDSRIFTEKPFDNIKATHSYPLSVPDILRIPTEVLKSGEDIFIERLHVFHAEEDVNLPKSLLARQIGAEFWRLQPSETIRTALLKFDGIDFSRGIGLHVRRPFPSWQAHPQLAREEIFLKPSNEFYINIIDGLRSKGFDGPVYLSTNCKETQSFFVEKVKNVHYHDSRSYNNSDDSAAIQDALIDMLMLSRTAVVTKYHASTFAFLASIIGNCQQCIIYNENGAKIVPPLSY